MAEACNVTARAGASHSKGFEDAVNSRISGELQEVESDLPDDIRDDALRVFRLSVANKNTIKGFIKFDYDTSVISINVNKFGNGNAQFSAGVGTKKMVCPDPFMGRLSDPNMNR